MDGYYKTIEGSIATQLPANVIDEILYGKENKNIKSAREIYENDNSLKMPEIMRKLENDTG